MSDDDEVTLENWPGGPQSLTAEKTRGVQPETLRAPDPSRPLTARHRRVAQLLSAGHSYAIVAREMRTLPRTIEMLEQNPQIQEEISRLQDRLFEETIPDRMKSLGPSALDVIESAVKDRASKFKSSEKLAAAQWLIEKLDGKATQKHDVGENLLGVLLDRLDAKKTAAPPSQIIDVQALPSPEEAPKEPERDPLADFVADFAKR